MIERLGLSEAQAKRKNTVLQRIYNITLEEFALILEFQGWGCAICGISYQPGKLFCVDHEHAREGVGPVRGIVCYRCNRYKIGSLRLDEISKIHNYMISPPAQNALGEVRIAVPEKKKKRIRRRVRGSKRNNA